MRTSLYAKIIPWFFISLAILVVLFVLLFKIDFRLTPGNPFQEQNGDQLLNIAWKIASELSVAPEDKREDIIAEYAKMYNVDLYVFSHEGYQIMGPHIALPSEVLKVVSEPGFPPGRHDPGRPERGIHHPPDHSRALPKKPPKQKHDSPRFSVKSSNPTTYWVGVRVPMRVEYLPPHPVIMLMASDSMTGHGLFWNPLPWIIAIGLFVILGILMWIPFIRNITRPIVKMTHAAEEMSKGHFDVQLDKPRSDEIGRLGLSINVMAKRLKGYLSGQRRFLADISHELSSPIARAKLALSIAEPQTEGKAKKRIRNALGELENMSDLVNKLLALTRSEIGPQKIKLQSVNIADIAQKAIDREKTEDSNIQLNIGEDLFVSADEDLLLRAIGNLIRNAVRYACQDGPITISAQKNNDNVIIEVSDHGPGVAEMELNYIFEPFYRAEGSRNRKTGGVGLGLAIVKKCVEACKGTVSATNIENEGFSVKIVLKKIATTHTKNCP